MIKQVIFIFLLLLASIPAASQDTLSYDDVEFNDSESDSIAQESIHPVSKNEIPAQGSVDENEKDSRTLWVIFLAGIAGGTAALFMPCIFPMLPFTVSYFTKGESHVSRSGVGKAAAYGTSIIIIYVLLGMSVTIIFGAGALNDLSTSGIFNLFFFGLLVLFAASLLGAFEITLPGSWANRMDSNSGRRGYIGIFFMAATLSVVSFSCTGPLIGALLVEAASTGSYVAPSIGMLGFSIALAFPFTLFAMFPSWLNALPKSGSWLNSVKVVLGFLELALALKFISNVDLAYHWEWFDREVFLVLWITIFGVMGFYLLGKIKLPNDSDVKYVGAGRLFLAIVTLAFTMYMIPGLWGAPLKAVSAFLPPQHTQDFDLNSSIASAENLKSADVTSRKYADLFHAPAGLTPFFDYEEGMNYARKMKKPVMIDFTGHACVNCRKMETTVWTDPKVHSRLQRDFVLIQLYVDDRTALPLNEQVVSAYSGKRITTIGKKWSDLQASQFNTNSQPFYVLLGPDGNQLTKPQGADYSIDHFIEFLELGKKRFEAG